MSGVRLLIVGPPGGALATAAAMARAAGAQCRHVDDARACAAALNSDAADLILADAGCDLATIIAAQRGAGQRAPLVACGVDVPAARAVAAIHLGAADFIPLPPEAAMIAAMLTLASAAAVPAASVRALVGHSMASVERALIEQTLADARGNRTRASAILGISVRTMRNKLRDYRLADRAAA